MGRLDYYTAEEFAKYIQAHIDTIRKYCRKGIIPGFKINGKWCMKKCDLEKFHYPIIVTTGNYLKYTHTIQRLNKICVD